MSFGLAKMIGNAARNGSGPVGAAYSSLLHAHASTPAPAPTPTPATQPSNALTNFTQGNIRRDNQALGIMGGNTPQSYGVNPGMSHNVGMTNTAPTTNPTIAPPNIQAPSLGVPTQNNQPAPTNTWHNVQAPIPTANYYANQNALLGGLFGNANAFNRSGMILRNIRGPMGASFNPRLCQKILPDFQPRNLIISRTVRHM